MDAATSNNPVYETPDSSSPRLPSVLIVDDSRDAANVLKTLLDAHGYTSFVAYDWVGAIDAAKKKAIEALPEEQKIEGKKLFDALKERIFRDEMLKAKRRPDGRKFDQVRKIECEVGVLPRTHGSSLFTRGETQALVTATLGTKDDEQRIELARRGREQVAIASGVAAGDKLATRRPEPDQIRRPR